MAKTATALSIFAALFVGFLQLTPWLLMPLAVLAAFGMSAYSEEAISLLGHVRNFVASIFMLSIIEWVARLASLYMTGHDFVGRV
ncbi:hypothetical protein [Prosthecomicrobium hirschii]|uniref:hypothetical protein n=1 Tax=Prosthecodimorpha hirschii TaxID=665126 RepID=UPI00221F84AF|nr:hypothetical protein [Prosthecomicrobium hirschii]MCW1843535.1 hypothetical protein [Prosthecomicrobium hirschii]